MDSIVNKHHKNVATVIHASVFAKYFFPFGNFVLPLIIWASYKKESEYIDHHGKEALNFQLSLFCYKLFATFISIPFFLIFGIRHVDSWDFFRQEHFHIDASDFFSFHSITLIGVAIGLWHLLFFAINITYTILAAIKASEGERYKYPFTITFFK